MTTFHQGSESHRRRTGEPAPTTSRRDFLKTSGALVVSFSAAGVTGADSLAAAGGGEEARGPAGGPLSRPRLQTARYLGRDSCRQHRDLLRREDGLRSRHGNGISADDVRRA